MSFRNRPALARLGVVGVIAGTAVAFAGGPAYAAADTDLALSLSGTTLAATTSGKVFDITITNKGEAAASGLVVTFDLGELDQDKVEFVVPTGENGEDVCEIDGDTVTCGVQDVPAGQNLDLGASLARRDGSGSAGKITVSIEHEGADPDESNNSDTADVAVSEDSGPDMFVYAPDVPFNPETNATEGRITVGKNGRLWYVIGNQGDVAATGIKLTVKLPEHVTFAAEESDCEYNSANNVATCTYENLPFVPVDQEDPDNDVFAVRLFYNDITVAADAPAPSVLAEGVVSAEPLVAEEQGPAVARRAAADVPRNVLEVPASLDVDPSDNADEFSVYVAPAGGGAGGDGELPITGVKVGVATGVGLAVVIAGALLLVSARRRRVVLVTPHDETPTA